MQFYYRQIIFIIIIFQFLPLAGQVILFSHDLDDKLYMAHVKSVDEFIQRLNAKELYPLLVDEDTNKVQTTRFTLFDISLLKDAEPEDSTFSLCKEFVEYLSSNPTEISLENPKNWIEAQCSFTWKDREKTLTLKLQLEEDSLHYWHWSIFDIDGLEQNGLLDIDDILRISPVEHEINFIGLQSIFQYDYTRLSGTRKQDLDIDRLSYFLGLVYSGQLKYNICKSVEFHCNQVPGYYFIAKEIKRPVSANSGWLITTLLRR